MPPPLDPAAVLQWGPASVLEWMRRTCLLEDKLRCLRRLALTGRALILRPAAKLRTRLLVKQRELYPAAGLDLPDALEAILDSLDDEVALLDAATAAQIQQLYEMRLRSRAEAPGGSA
eukprot:tig00000262_g23079.t1